MLQLSNGDLLSGGCGNDISIRVWDLNTGLTKYILNKHTLCINGFLSLDNGDLLSCSNDFSIIVWG